MALEIRPIVADEMDEFNRLVRIAFASGPDMTLKIPPEWTLCGFQDGKMATTYAAWPLTMYLNGNPVTIAGVTMVGTLPVFRRRNYLRQVTLRHFQTLHERGERPIAALYASMAAIYQRYGYAVVSTHHAYNVDPCHLEFNTEIQVKGELREVGDDKDDQLLDVYHRFVEGRNGYLERKGDFMTIPGAPFATLMPPSQGVPAKVVYEEEEGCITGYVVYQAGRDMQSPRGLGQRLDINDLVWLTPSACRAIWEYLARMDLVNTVGWWRVPPDDPLPHLLLEPRKLNVTAWDGLLARIVDIEKALPLRKYSQEASLVFEVIDNLCSWNRGVWKLNASPDGTAIGQTSATPQLTMPVSTLAMLVFGQLNATEAARMGRLDVSDSSALPIWDDVMRTDYRPFCANNF